MDYGAVNHAPEKDKRTFSVTSATAPVCARQSSFMSHHSDTEGKKSDDTTETDHVAKQQKKSLTRRQILVLFAMSLYYFTIMCAYSMLAPFFPSEGKRKGANQAIVGLIFGVFPLVSFLSSPVYGIFITSIGAKFMLLTGLFVEASTLLLFGFVDLMPDGKVFILFCFLIRIVCGLGSSATATASMAIITEAFQENLATAMGFLETFGGLGLMIGPLVGGLLYQAGGFKMPFLVLGGLILASIIPVSFLLPRDKEPDVLPQEEEEKVSPITAYKNPAILLMATVITVGGIILSFLDPTLALHLDKFHLNKEEIGLMFLILSAVYTLLAPLFGCIADRRDTRVMISSGSLISAASLLLMGPSPLLKNLVHSTLWLIGLSLGLLGLGIAPLIIPTIADMHKSARKQGLPDTLATHGVISGIFNSFINVGAIIGPTAAGTFSQKLSFPWACTILAGLILAMGLIVILFTFVERLKERKIRFYEEERGLLAPSA